MRDYRDPLEKMGENIPPSSHTATILHNVPESWRAITQIIRMITQDPDDIEERLEANEANLNTIEISNQTSMAFISQSQPP